MPSKIFDADDFAAFLDLLPAALNGMALRHCVEVRHASFADPRFTALCGQRGVAICLADSPKFPMIDAVTANFTYARLMRGVDDIATGYAPEQLDTWAVRFHGLEGPGGANPRRDVFAFFISAGKLRAPAAAMALAERAAGGLHGAAVQS